MFWTIVFAILFVYFLPAILGLIAGILCWLFGTKEGWITIGGFVLLLILMSLLGCTPKEEEKSDYDIPAWAMKYQISRWDTPIQSGDTVFLYGKEFPANFYDYEDVDTVVIDGLEYDISDF